MSSDQAFLVAARSIGQRLAADAVWHDGRCSWMGPIADPVAPRRVEWRGIGPTLYGGTAGVGLFLAHLAALTGEPAVRTLAIGALRHALDRTAALPSDRRDGFHAGPVGVAWAAARAASVLDAEELLSGARAALAQARAPLGPERCPDLVMGAAGAIIGLLALAAEFDDPRLVERSRAAGDELVARATVGSRGWSWAGPGRSRLPHLCGISHGVAGIGSALLELFAATGDEKFRIAGMGAFDYERSWLDADSGTWPDLRLALPRRGARAVPSPSVGTWCHGEAGIALTRVRAASLLGPGAHREDADIALETTRRHLAAALPYELDDLSLCHGVGGAADVLLCGAAGLGATWSAAATLAADLGRIAIERHGATGDGWPCGTPGGASPGLFVGLSGLGWLFLRLHDPSIPTPFAPVDSGAPQGIGSAESFSRLP